MQIQVEDNPNCPASEQYFFNELAAPRPVRALRVTEGGRDVVREIASVDGPASAVKISDSGEGFAYLIYGGKWGICLRPEGGGPWDLADPEQQGEPFKIYGNADDILYAG